ncbi:N-acetylmuramoyl-L-alanine amidase [Rhodospirillum centenum]|uniref:N-acetylmuramoyl-L-alanine amidase n=1 Tax=Rhodospirillum centenum TaxID=34018 RepID=UPI0006746F76|nr:N-acetylmuramoyl-L-alanine amidase [Rhodospirillum centenum]
MSGWAAAVVAALLLVVSPVAPVAAAERTQTAAMPAAGAAALATDARLGLHPDKTRFVIDLSRAAEFRVVTAADPWRVVVEFDGVAWAVPELPAPKGLVRGVRRSEAGGRVRLELETSGPAKVLWADMLRPLDGRPPRFVLDIAPMDPLGFLAAQAAAMPSAAAPSPLAPGVQPVALRAPAPPPAAPATAPPAPSQPAALRSFPVPRSKPPLPQLPLIVLDPGHGGQDPGATAVTGVHEKEITLAVALEMRRQLQATGRYRVALTRDRDVFIKLRDRVARARSLGADLFISLHADSISRPGVRGLSVYTLSDKATDREAEMLAQRENRADAIVGLDLSAETAEVAAILIDLAQRDSRNQSLRLAGLVVDRLGREVALLPSPLRSAGFAVLTAPDVPSVLIEMGYLSHAKDAKLLTSASHRKRLAAGLVQAVDGYFGRARS